MKIAQINSVYGIGSTGRIVLSIENEISSQGKSICYYGRTGIDGNGGVKIASSLSVYSHAILSRIFGKHGLYSKGATKKLIKYLKEYNPDVIHLHNLHGYYVNYKLLFEYLKKVDKPVVWTLHDQWAITGHCAYFTEDSCTELENGCKNCKFKGEYPSAFIDNTAKNFKLKKELISSIKNLTFVTPSEWLKGYINKFYPEKKCVVINNGINLESFKNTHSDFIEKYNLQGKKIILGVSLQWSARKGLDYFNRLANDLGDDYKILLVGEVFGNVDSKILTIPKTNSIDELVKIYSASYLFVNPTLLENFPTVNIEALACGLPVITFNTGGSAEIIDQSCGISVPKGDYEKFKQEILNYKDNFKKSDCVLRAQCYTQEKMVEKYVSLYKELI